MVILTNQNENKQFKVRPEQTASSEHVFDSVYYKCFRIVTFGSVSPPS